MALLMGVLHIRYRVNATLAGMAVNLLGLALSALLLKLIWNVEGFSPAVRSFSTIASTPSLAWMAGLPVIGRIVGEQSFFLFVCIFFIIVGWVFMYKTPYGLHLRMVGENPMAANSVGINTTRYKYLGVIVCGVLSGLAGTYLSVVGLNRYVVDMSAGRGFVALVINNLGGSNPFWSAMSALFYGFFDSMQFVFQGVDTPQQLLMMTPYVFILIVCLISAKRSRGPAGIGKFFDS
jgi:simple sugar transport system permease protein